MKGLRIICIFTLVALFVLGSMGTVFAKADNPGKGPYLRGDKQGFAGNVTGVADGNVTIATEDKGDVTVELPEDAFYKIPREMNKWDNLTEFKSYLAGGNLSALEGRRVVVLAGNSTGAWVAIKFMLLPIPGTQPMHAHRTGNVTEFNKPASGNSWIGNITIIDVHGVSHLFKVGNETIYRPAAIDSDNITVGSFVTVVTTGNQKSVEWTDLPVAKAIVLHANLPED